MIFNYFQLSFPSFLFFYYPLHHQKNNIYLSIYLFFILFFKKNLEDIDEALVDLALLALADALGDPDDVADLLLLELEVRVEDAVPHLRLEGELVELHLLLEERVLERPVRRPDVLEQLPVVREVAHGLAHLLQLVSLRELGRPRGVQVPKVGVELGAVVLRELSPERVDSDGDSSSISLKLKNNNIIIINIQIYIYFKNCFFAQ